MVRPRSREYKAQMNIQVPLDLIEYVDSLPYQSRSEAVSDMIREHRKNRLLPSRPLEELWTEDPGGTGRKESQREG